ncbi:MAG: transposase IS4 family protein [Methylocystaceae bacterium]|nr:MAG: transposase IS4 family protein [Methylocystaceae bacterium]KAF0212169.1 MAG: transposase IS4 family [Methylocystaceae bacterium]TXT44039.1 MAG: transposase IS4 family protein [Methylocystaceae bacterium]
MMGVQVTSARLFYDFCLDDHVPSDHMLRSIDRHLNLDDVRQALKPFYSSTGRPSIDPELMIRMLIVGYCMGIRSERRLCEEVHLNLAYRWFCRLGLDGKIPDHSTFSKNRHGRFRESNVLRHLFEAVVERCMAEGLVGADGFAIDASLIAADANKQRSVPSDEWKPQEIKDKACRAAREYLATLDNAAFGAASAVMPKFISPSDPAAQWTGAHKGHAFFAYATNYLIDTDHGVIVDVEATRAIRQAEVGAARTMLERTEDRFGLKPEYLTADSACGSAESLAWLVKQKKITPHIPVFDKSTRTDGTFSRADFSFDTERDRYTCPAGKELVQFRRTYATPRTGVTAEGTRLYRASKKDCGVCELKARCCPNAVARKIPRDLHEDARDVARALASTPEYATACRRRKKVEMLFAHLKRILRLGRLRLRGPSGAKDEFLLAATAQNLRRLARLRPANASTGAIAA